MLEIVESGVLGKILGVEGKFCYTMDEDEMDHHVFNPENGGGSLLDVGVYGLNFVSWYLGKDVTEIKAQSDFYDGVKSEKCLESYIRRIICKKQAPESEMTRELSLLRCNKVLEREA